MHAIPWWQIHKLSLNVMTKVEQHTSRMNIKWIPSCDCVIGKLYCLWSSGILYLCGRLTSRFCKEYRSPCQAACNSCAWGGRWGLDIHPNTFPWSSGGLTWSAVCWLLLHRVISAPVLSSRWTTCSKHQEVKQNMTQKSNKIKKIIKHIPVFLILVNVQQFFKHQFRFC